MTWAAGFSRDGRGLLRRLGLEHAVLGGAHLRAAVARAIAGLRADVAPDGSVRGTPAEWEQATRAALLSRYGEAGPAARAAALRGLTAADRPMAAALAYSGLAAHPCVALALCEAVQ